MKCKAQTAAGMVIEFIVDMFGYTKDEARFLSWDFLVLQQVFFFKFLHFHVLAKNGHSDRSIVFQSIGCGYRCSFSGKYFFSQ